MGNRAIGRSRAIDSQHPCPRPTGRWRVALRSIVRGFLSATLVSACGGGGESGGGGSDSKGPGLLRADAPSNHYVVVTFDETADGDALSVENYEISGPTSSLPVLAASMEEKGDEVTLATGAQQPVQYSLTYRSATSAAQSATFDGSITNEPFLATAIALSETSLLLTFRGEGSDQPWLFVTFSL
jgi:hypothetical protein